MPDLGRRLGEELNMVPADVQWVTAWSIRSRELDSKPLPFLKTLAEALGWPLNRYETLALLIFSSVLAVDLWFWELFFGTAVNLASLAGSWIDQLNVLFWPRTGNEDKHKPRGALLYKCQCKENSTFFCSYFFQLSLECINTPCQCKENSFFFCSIHCHQIWNEIGGKGGILP